LAPGRGGWHAASVAETPHLIITIDAAPGLVRAVRAGPSMASEDAVGEMRSYARETLRGLARARYGLLLDLRAAPIAEESRYAGPMKALRRELTAGFRRAAFLVETKTGALQTRRFVREEGLAVTVFEDEREALDFLAAP
jgi:hypothetical protein